MSYIFKNASGTMLVVNVNTTLIPAGYYPVVPGSYKIKMGDSKSLNVSYITIQANQTISNPYKNFLVSVGSPTAILPPPAPSAPPEPALTDLTPPPVLPPATSAPSTPATGNVSPGGVYLSPTSFEVYTLPSGTTIPAGWINVPVGSYVFTNKVGYVISKPQDGVVIPNNYYPISFGIYLYKSWDRTGMSFTTYSQKTNEPVIADGATYLIGYSGNGAPPPVPPGEQDFTPTQAAAAAAAEADPTIPALPAVDIPAGKSKPSSTIPWATVSKVIAVIGAAGVAYVGYLYITSPKGFRDYAEKLHELTGIVIDLGYMMIILAIIAGLSFVAYEFFNAYNETGSVVDALGQMTAATIETLVSAIVDAIEVLAKDAWNFVWGEVSTVVPSWL